jgi:MoxR-like ATPase
MTEQLELPAPPVYTAYDIEPVGFVEIEGGVTLANGEAGVVKLPTYDVEQYPHESYGDLVPTNVHYVDLETKDSQSLVYDIAAAWQNGQIPHLAGHAGTGKSYTARYLAQLMGVPHYRTPLTQGSEANVVSGEMGLTPTGTRYIYGNFAGLLIVPSVQNLDELPKAPGDVQEMLRPLFDSGYFVIGTHPEKPTFRPHRHAQIMTTGNPHWSGKYIGVAPMDEADYSRLTHIWVDFPTTTVEWQILTPLVESLPNVTREMAATAVHLFHQLRNLVEADSITCSAGTRDLQSFIMNLNTHPADAAMRRVYGGDRSDPEQLGQITALVDAYSFTEVPNEIAADLGEAKTDFFISVKAEDYAEELQAETPSEPDGEKNKPFTEVPCPTCQKALLTDSSGTARCPEHGEC